MALINCPECKKEISDKAQSCPNCGCPINISISPNVTNKNKVANTYKKFDFEHMRQMANDTKLKENHKIYTRKESRFATIVAIIILIITVLIQSSIKNGSTLGLLVLAGYLFSIGFFYVGIRTFFAANSTNDLKEQIKDRYYKRKIKTFSSVPLDLNYEEISSITAKSKDELLEKAYSLYADALINVQVQRYTSSDTKSKFNGIGAKRRIETKVNEHENWTAGAVRINSDIYHNPINSNNLFSN